MEYASRHGEGIAFRTLTTEQNKSHTQRQLPDTERGGVVVHHDEATELLKKAGAYAGSDGRVRLPDALIEWAIRSAPSRVALYNRLGNPAMFWRVPTPISEQAPIP